MDAWTWTFLGSNATKPAESQQVKQMRAYGMYVPPQMLQNGSGIPLTRLRQICCHPNLIDKTSGKEHDSAKLTATLELIEELHAGGHKVLLFSQFVTMLDIIRDKLTEMSIPYYWLTGSTNNRSEVVDQFQKDTDPCVFLLSLKAGGSGLNLTAASYVILYDPWWNPAVEAQAIDRAHRIGQTQPVMAYRMITKDTIEEKIMLLQQKKQLMSANILGEGGFAGGDVVALEADDERHGDRHFAGRRMMDIEGLGERYIDTLVELEYVHGLADLYSLTLDKLLEMKLRADERVPYGKVVEVMGLAQQAGMNRIGFVTERKQPLAAP